MSHHPYSSRSVFRAVTGGLDFGLRVRVELRRPQRTIFSGSPDSCAQDLTAELVEMVSSFRVYSYGVRAQLEQLTHALQVNVDCGFLFLARRAALDLSGVLALAGKRRQADPIRCTRGANMALRIAELCSKGVR
jgi:hypothetical protein